jgi:hypothetical protein
MTANNGCFPDEKNVLDINNLPVAVLEKYTAFSVGFQYRKPENREMTFK